MKERENGVTLVALAITIIVLLIVAGIAVYQGASIVQSSKLQSLKTNLLLIQAKVQIYAEQANFAGNNDGLKGSVLTAEKVLGGTVLPANEEKVRSLSKQDLTDMGLDSIDEEDGDFIADYRDNEVYYVEGYQTKKDQDGNQNTYYKASEIVQLTSEDTALAGAE